MSHVKKEMISFFLTSKCNLDCIYCYTNKENFKHKDQTLSYEFAKLGIDLFIQKYPHIRFFGAGEPTQAFKLMKKIYNYALKKAGYKIKSELQTNGAFNTKVRNWISENIEIIWVSFDGTPEIQDYNRPFFKSKKPSSPIIEKNVLYLAKNGKGHVGARVTITDKNTKQQKEMVDYFASLGIMYIWTDPLFPAVGDKPISQSIEAIDVKPLIDLDTYVVEFIEAQKYAKQKNIFFGSFLSCNFDEENIYHCSACIPVPHLTTDGYISACDMALFGNDNNHMQEFIYGKWDQKNNKLVFDKDKIERLHKRSVENMIGCKDCTIRLNCGGYCLGEVANETGSMFGNKKYTCKAIKKLAIQSKRNFGCYKYLHP